MEESAARRILVRDEGESGSSVSKRTSYRSCVSRFRHRVGVCFRGTLELLSKGCRHDRRPPSLEEPDNSLHRGVPASVEAFTVGRHEVRIVVHSVGHPESVTGDP
jgi:hypothetical protein